MADVDETGPLAGLQVMVTGVEALVSRDVVRLLVAEGAGVTAADADEDCLARLQRDLGLYRTSAELAPIDLARRSEMSLFATNLRALGRLPHLIVCCCREAECRATLARSQLSPSLALHIAPRERWGRIIRRLITPSLSRVLDPARGGLFNPDRRIRRVLIAGHVFDLAWSQDSPDPPAVRRIRATPPCPSASPPRVGSAA